MAHNTVRGLLALRPRPSRYKGLAAVKLGFPPGNNRSLAIWIVTHDFAHAHIIHCRYDCRCWISSRKTTARYGSNHSNRSMVQSATQDGWKVVLLYRGRPSA